MRIVAISDTHGKHHELGELPRCDVAVCAGDVTGSGQLHVLEDFADYFGKQPARYKVFVAGNHDWCFVREHERRAARGLLLEHGIIYLQDEAATLCGRRFYGSPWVSTSPNWAWHLERGCVELSEKWEAIPLDTEILVTHTPPAGILDWSMRNNERVGDGALRWRVERLRKLRVHIFGHIHESYGVEHALGRPVFYNACSLNRSYITQNAPLVIDL